MKAVLMSIRPKWIAKILNGEKTIEVRKSFTANYRGWVYIYCTKDKEVVMKNIQETEYITHTGKFAKNLKIKYHSEKYPILNGKVVARFYCDKVEEIKNNLAMRFFTESANEKELLEKSCLNSDQLFWYLAPQELKVKCCGYAIHISKLEIFDKPKELSEFYPYCKDEKCEYRSNHCSICYRLTLTKAPQSYRFIEVDNEQKD